VAGRGERGAGDALGVEAVGALLGVVAELGESIGHGLRLEVVAEAVWRVSKSTSWVQRRMA
jgi:hypothetical protein